MICLNRVCGYGGVQQKGTALPLARAGVPTAPYLSTKETVTAILDILREYAGDAFARYEPANTIMSVHMLATMPNQSFLSAIDITMIKGKDLLMSSNRHQKNHEILDDQEEEEFMALSMEVISDLIDEEPDICTIDDVKVRFR